MKFLQVECCMVPRLITEEDLRECVRIAPKRFEGYERGAMGATQGTTLIIQMC